MQQKRSTRTIRISRRPKNFRSIGGGGGGPGGGGGGPGGGAFAVLTGTIGFGIATGTELAEKIFRPPPEYTSDSVTSIASIRNVGSSCADVVPTFFAVVPTTLPAKLPGATATAGPVFAAAGVVFAGAVTTTGAATGAGVSSCNW
jgi:hypothetical protein